MHHLSNLAACEKEERAALSDTLHILARMSWQDIMSSPRHGRGSEKIPAKQLKVPLPGLADDDQLLAFRFYGSKPMLATRKGRVLRILYLDRNHDAYS